MDIYYEFHKAIAVVDREVLLGVGPDAYPTLEDRVEMARIAIDLVRLSVEWDAFHLPDTEEPQP
jgi:hypothetical protein